MDGQMIIYVVGGVTIATNVGTVVWNVMKSNAATEIMKQAFNDYKEYNNQRYGEFKSDFQKSLLDFKENFVKVCEERSGNIQRRVTRNEQMLNGKRDKGK